ncbi:MAG: DUF4190 domain-containing protein [Rhodoglobus sp.]
MSDPITPDAVPAPPVPAAAPTPPKPKSGLTLAALILGIVAMLCAVIPGLSFIAFVPALVALVLGIIGLASKAPGRGKALAGVILGPVAFIVAIIVSVSFIAGGVRSTVDDTEPTPIAAPESPSAEEEPEPEPTVEVPADIVYSGTGDSILAIALPDGPGQVAVATVTHDGSRNFAIFSLDAGMAQQDLIVNTIGPYQGTVLFNAGFGGDPSSLEITADGNWTVTMKSVLSLRQFSGNAVTGVGDDVVLYLGDAGAATISHDGSRNFAIWLYGDSTDLAVNEIGPYNGTVRWMAGPSVVAVTADGNWGVTVN